MSTDPSIFPVLNARASLKDSVRNSMASLYAFFPVLNAEVKQLRLELDHALQ